MHNQIRVKFQKFVNTTTNNYIKNTTTSKNFNTACVQELVYQCLAEYIKKVPISDQEKIGSNVLAKISNEVTMDQMGEKCKAYMKAQLGCNNGGNNNKYNKNKNNPLVC